MHTFTSKNHFNLPRTWMVHSYLNMTKLHSITAGLCDVRDGIAPFSQGSLPDAAAAAQLSCDPWAWLRAPFFLRSHSKSFESWKLTIIPDVKSIRNLHVPRGRFNNLPCVRVCVCVCVCMCAEVSLDHGKVAYLRGLVIPRALRVGQYSNTHFLYIKAYYQFSNTSHNLGVGQCECVGTPLVCSCACVCVCVCVCVAPTQMGLFLM